MIGYIVCISGLQIHTSCFQKIQIKMKYITKPGSEMFLPGVNRWAPDSLGHVDIWGGHVNF